jgi:hypothetical protein
MKRRSKPPQAAVTEATPTADAGEVLQIKVWLAGISPMIWRRILVPAAFSLRELHRVIQVTMGWEGIHLYQFCLRAARYGSWEVSAASPDATLAALRFRKGARFVYEYDLLPDGPRQARRLGQISAARTGSGVSDGVNHRQESVTTGTVFYRTRTDWSGNQGRGCV